MKIKRISFKILKKGLWRDQRMKELEGNTYPILLTIVASRLANLSHGGSEYAKGKTPIGVSLKEASDMFNVGTSTIDRVREIESKKPEEIERIEKGEVTIGKIYGELKREEADTPEWLRFLDVWNFKENTGEGLSNLPPEILKNLFYYYTKEGDLIYDCFAGSGQTYEIAKEMKRKCICSDISPSKKFIIKADVDKRFPKEVKDVDFLFLDPPYWNMVDYGEGWSNTSLKEFYEKFDRFVKQIRGILKDDGVVALIIMPIKEKKYYDIGFECYRIFLNNGFKIEQRLCVPLMRNWAFDPRIKKGRENKEIVTSSLRDLIIFKKEVH